MTPVRPDTLLDEGTREHPDESMLLDFSSGALGVGAADAVVAHLDTCSRCRQLVSSLTRADTGGMEAVADEKEGPDAQATRVGVDMLLGQRVGEYRVLERINQGGMGVLYRGEHAATGKPVAVKVLLPELAADPNLVHRLLGEARAVNSIRHPNIIDIFALGQLPDDRHYMVMELLEGQSLAELLKERGRLQPAEVQVVLEQASAALQAAHDAGVIHRDIKPENIFANTRVEGWRVTLLDFGLAKQRGGLNNLTAPNLVLGTPGYMAPEQIRGHEPTPAIDVYALGICAWALLAGREPFAGGSVVEVMKRHLDAPVPQVRAQVPGVPLALEALIAKMMAKDPALRPTADEVRQAVARLKNDPRRFDPTPELTQLDSPLTMITVPPAPVAPPVTLPAGTKPVPPASAALTASEAPVTLPAGTKPVPPASALAASASPIALLVGTKPLLPPPAGVARPDPALLITRPDRPPPAAPSKTLAEVQLFLEHQGLRRLPLLMIAIGLALLGGAVGVVFFQPPPTPAPLVEPAVELQPAPEAAPPEPIVEVDPPRRIPSRVEVERSVASARTRLSTIGSASRRRALSAQLGKLEERLRKNEPPQVVAQQLEKLLDEAGLR